MSEPAPDVASRESGASSPHDGRAWPRWLSWAAEACALVLGVLLRWSLTTASRGWELKHGYDFDAHLKYLRYVADRRALPPVTEFYVAYHPPLYYRLGGWLLRHAVTNDGLMELAIACGVLRLVVLWVGLRLFIKSSAARVVALVLAGVLPANLYLDGMLGNEPLHALLAWVALLGLALALRAQGRARLAWAAAAGVALGGAIATKVSSLALGGPVLIAVLVELAPSARPVIDRLGRALAPWLVGVIGLGVGLPPHARHLTTAHKLLPTTYDTTPWEREKFKKVADTPYLDRRPLGYPFGPGGLDIFKEPWAPSGTAPSRFWPQLLATAFADYYNIGFDGVPRAGEPVVTAAWHPLRQATVRFQQRSVAGGLVITLVALGALAVALRSRWRTRDAAAVALLTAPLAAALGQLHFAISFPFDNQGVVKAHYLMFATPALFAMYGVAVVALARHRFLRVLAVIALAALALVCAYTLRTRHLL